MRRHLAMAAAAAALALPLIMTAQANASTPAPHPTSARPDTPALTPYEICDLGTNNLCLNDVGDSFTGGTPINLNSYGAKYTGEFWQVASDNLSNCGTQVTPTCPFRLATYNNHFNTDPIVHLELNNHTAGCASSQGDTSQPVNNLALEACSGATAAWVMFPIIDGGFGFVNVAYTNTNPWNDEMVLNGSNTAGDQGTVDIWANGPDQAWTEG
jgi:hypothetical protein